MSQFTGPLHRLQACLDAEFFTDDLTSPDNVAAFALAETRLGAVEVTVDAGLSTRDQFTVAVAAYDMTATAESYPFGTVVASPGDVDLTAISADTLDAIYSRTSLARDLATRTLAEIETEEKLPRDFLLAVLNNSVA